MSIDFDHLLRAWDGQANTLLEPDDEALVATQVRGRTGRRRAGTARAPSDGVWAHRSGPENGNAVRRKQNGAWSAVEAAGGASARPSRRAGAPPAGEIRREGRRRPAARADSPGRAKHGFR